MLILARLIGMVVMAMGISIAIKPGVFRAVIGFWKEGKRIYIAGITRLIFGVIFLLVSSECRLPVLISVLGVLMIIGGIVLFLIGPKRIQPIFVWWGKRNSSILRLMGLIAFTMGALILYSI